ncbi:MAG: bifunctional phosphoribosylaminoimidazolecarboxamide formyltransferase/IMP cyclohydrolase [Deltaproteobacteria bacterium]|nr:bifunctional phosphoribosylaminoimidazolecarboxamide formyltransferase/IMP cyclohydrolase [Deltaproteobacteria bacterium]
MTRPRALLSVHDKSGLDAFARGLSALGFELVASGGTAKAIAAAGLEVVTVESVTGFAELLGGRVKTLHPAIHGGILSRRDEADARELQAVGIGTIDLVAVTLYPFEAALARGASPAELIEEIDIGGVALLRAAAKSFLHVTVVPGVEHYDEVLAALGGEGDLGALRRRLAARAFLRTSLYDRYIADWLGGQVLPLRYGENPHQSATFTPGPGGLPFSQLGGKDLSYNNLLDLDAAWAAVSELAAPGVCIVKHGSPSGIATGDSLVTAWGDALASDPVSAFGGVVAVNRVVDGHLVTAIGDLFIEVLAAPGLTGEAAALLAAKKKNCRVLIMGEARSERVTRTVLGGTLTQTPDAALPEPASWRHVAGPAPTPELEATLAFAFHVVKHVKSNAIVLAHKTETGFATVGIGGGQTNRIDAVHQAIGRAGVRARGAALASDAFFPFPDGVVAAADAGIAAVVEPGGAMRDAEVIAAAEARGVTLVFTDRRHFRH